MKLALLAVVALGLVASSAHAMPMADAVTVAPIVSAGPDVFDPPPPATCPDRDSDAGPVDACPDGCNYDSGNASDPCPHADADYVILRCDVDRSVVHETRDAYENPGSDEHKGIDDPTTVCGGTWVALSVQP